ncbi:MAG: hypothetical protein R2780_05255 [Crocinitomicaceae bacterium]|nr:hypothetical protein [Crocinitomicaceae bacterium]
MKNFLFFLICSILFSCNSQTQTLDFTESLIQEDTIEMSEEVFDLFENSPNDRTEIIKNLEKKISGDQPLIVHCLVPLCDNKHQGIVPTSESLGDGFSLRTNLYWSTSYGMKNYFVKSSSWKSLPVDFAVSDTILERVAFERKFENGATVILICDAYRGDMMKPCLEDYFSSLAGHKTDSILYKNEKLAINQGADLMAFNGHNGLMDVDIDTVYADRSRMKDAVVIACSSKGYFNPYFVQTNSYPLLNTSSLLWPGAMILNAVIREWAMLHAGEDVQNAAGDSYHEVKKCGQSAARRMFVSGW